MEFYCYRAIVIRVVDGDTAHVEVDLGMDIRHRTKLRFFGINAPELSTPEGQAAKDFLTPLLDGKVVRIQTIKDKTEKYGRYLAKVFLEDGTDINALLVNTGHAVEKAY